MKAVLSNTKRFLAAFLAAAMVLTMLPAAQTKVWAETPDASQDDAAVEEPLETAETSESLGNSGADSEDFEEKEPEVIAESDEDLEPLKSTEGAAITIGTIPTGVKLFTVNGGVATAVTIGEIKAPSEKDFVLYAVPQVGKAFDANVATVAGAYSDANDVVHTITKDTDYTIAEPAEKDVTYNTGGVTVPLQSALADTEYYWNNAKMITIKSNYLMNYEGRRTNPAPTVADVPISITIKDMAALEYELPVYIYDDTETISPTYHTYSQSTRITMPKVTYGTLNDMNIDLAGAVSASDWTAYDWTGSIAVLKKDLSGTETTTPAFAASNDSTAWGTEKSDGEGKYFFADKKIGITAKSNKLGYLTAEKKLGEARFAIILTKSTKGAVAGNKRLFAVDTSYVDFKFTNESGEEITDQYIEGTAFTGKKVLAAAASGNNEISAVAKNYGSPVSGISLPGGGNPSRTLPQNKENITWKMGTEDAVESAAFNSGWTIPTTTISTAPTADVEILAQTQETIALTLKDASTKGHLAVNYAEKNGSSLTSAIDVATNTGAKITDINTGSTLKFKAHATAGYQLNKITYTRYSADGTGIVVSDEELVPVDGVCTISDITGFVDINIDAEKISSTLTVKKDNSVGSNIDLKDVNTTETINTTGGTFAEKNKAYYFKAEPQTGYYIKGITAKAGDGDAAVDVSVNYDSTKKQYWIAGVAAGPIVIKPEQTAALAITKFTNADATLTVDGETVADTKSATVTGDTAAVLTVTPNNGATVTGVYYSTSNSIATQSAMNTAVAAGTTAWKLTSDDTTYRISGNDIKQIAKSNRQIYVYVTTTRDALVGTDYASVEFYDSQGAPEDITGGLTLWAADGTDATSVGLGDSADERSVVAKWLDSDGSVVCTSPASSTDQVDRVKYSLAKTTGSSDTNTKIAALSANKILPTKYNGGTASTDSDVLSVEYNVVDNVAGATTKFPATVTYKADLNVTVKPVRDFYETLDFAVTTSPAGLSGLIGEKKIRVNDGTLADTATLTPHGKIAETATSAAVDDTLASSTKAVAATGITFTTTPKMKSAEEQAEYKLNGSTTTNKVTADTATISVAKKIQTINASAEVKFVDGTTATISDAIDIVGVNYGYFAIPAITVNGTSTTLYSGAAAGTVSIETGTEGVVSGTVKYDVYHALTSAGATHFTTYDLNDAAAVTTAINAGTIEKVNASDINWTSLEGPAGFAKYFTVTPGVAGEFTIGSVSKTPSAQTLTLTAASKADGCVVQLPSGSSVSVSVAQKLARYDLTINTKDAGAKASSDYIYPTLTWNMGYAASDIIGISGDTGKVTGTALLDVPVSKTFTLPGEEAFTGVDPRRTLAGWKDGDGGYHKIGDEFTTKGAAATTLTAIWAFKFQSSTGAYNSSNAGKILAVNEKTGAAVASPLNIATGETVTIIPGFYPLDTSVAISGSDTGYTYSSTLDTVDDTTKLELATTSIAEGKTYLGADDEGKFAGSVLTGVEPTSSSLAATLTYTAVAEDAVYTANVSAINVTNSEVWQLSVNDVTIENGQTEEVDLASLKKGTSLETLADTTISAENLSPTFTYAPEGVATVTVSTNKLSVKALKQGSTDVTMKFVSANNVEVSTTFKVTVTKANVDIIVKVTPDPATPSKTPETTTVAEGEPAYLWIGNNNIAITLKDNTDGSTIDPSNVTFANTTFVNGNTAAAVSGANLTLAAQVWSPSSLGTATATIGVTLKGSGKVYSRTVDIVSCGLVKVGGPKTATNISISGADKAENILFKVYEGSQVDDNEVAADKIAYVPVAYDATKGATDKYSVPLSSFTAKWVNTDVTEEFLGWGPKTGSTVYGHINEAAATFEAYGYKGALAGEPIQLTASDIQSGTEVYAYFMAEPISDLVGLPTEVRLTDEKVSGVTIAAADTRTTKDGTDWEDFDIQVRPATSVGAVKVSASEKDILDIASKTQNGTAGDYGKNTSAETLQIASAGTPWNGTKTLTLGQTVNAAKTRRVDNFRIGKVAGKVGTAYLYFSTDTQEYDPVPVYLNGEYTGTDTKKHYMEDGSDLKDASRTVDGEVHFYGSDGILVEDGSVYDKETGRWVLIVSSAQYTNVGKYTTKKDGVDVTYYVDNDGFLAGGLFAGCITTGSKKDSDKKYYAFTDAETAPVLSISKFEELDGKLYFFDNNGQLKTGTGAEFTSLTSTEDSVWKGTFDYVVSEDGAILTKDFITVGEIKYYVNSYGQKVTYAMAEEQGTAPKYTDPETKVVYVIDKDTNAAEEDDKIAASAPEWTSKPKVASFVSGVPVITATVTLTSQKGRSIDPSVVEIPASIAEEDRANGKVTYRATADLSKYYKPGYETKYTATETTQDYVYNLDKNGNPIDGASGNTGDEGKTDSEPEESEVASYVSYNLFYNNIEIAVPGLGEALETEGAAKTGKWVDYFEADGDTVTIKGGKTADVTKVVKKAASAANSLITVTLPDGQFTYQLPVYYLKPSLKLSSSKGSVKIGGGEQTVSTTVQEKKSTGLFEDLEVDDAVTLDNWKNTVYKPASEGGDFTYSVTGATVSFTAAKVEKNGAKGNGKIRIQKETWREPVDLTYSITESQKNVLTGSEKQITFNLNDVENSDAQEFKIFYNGSDSLNAEDPVTVTLPNNWGDSGLEGLENGSLESADISLKFKSEASPVARTYTVKFTTGDKASYSLKVVVSKNDLKKDAITLNYKTKIDLTTGQKGVVIPTLKGVGGPLEETVELSGTYAEQLSAAYNPATNQIIVTPNAENTLTTASKADLTFKMTAGGVACETTIKNFQLQAKNPAVKLGKITLPKSKIIDMAEGAEGAAGETNILATYKQGGKTFSVQPEEVTFMVGKDAAQPESEGSEWYVVNTKDKVLARYDAETGTIYVKAQNTAGKAGSVKVAIRFPGQTKAMNKSFTVAVDAKN